MTTRAAADGLGDGDIPRDVRQAALGRALQALAGLAKASDECAGAHLVGGALRDALLRRSVIEADVVVPSDARGCADALARAVGGSAHRIGVEHELYRVPLDGGGHVDILPMRPWGGKMSRGPLVLVMEAAQNRPAFTTNCR